MNVLLMTAVSALVLLEQDLPMIRLGGVDALSGQISSNFLHLDLNRDEASDLLFVDTVAFQQGGAFPAAGRTPLPLTPGPYWCDGWDDTIFVLSADRFVRIEWTETGWTEHVYSDPPWALETEPAVPMPDKPRLQRFLHDFDSDGMPEVVLSAADGLHVYSIATGACVPAGRLDVFPPVLLARPRGQAIWPVSKRRFKLPARNMASQLMLSEDEVTVIQTRDEPDGQVRYILSTYAITRDAAGNYGASEPQRSTSALLPAFTRACRLNADSILDFAGTQWQMNQEAIVPTPIHKTFATTDGGRTYDIVRSQSFRPQCSFIDYDGDGRLDMIVERAHLFDAGARELIARLTTRTALDHGLAIHLQDSTGRFSPKPQVIGKFRIEFEAPPLRADIQFRDYQTGQFLDITGDFNADGTRDAVVQTRPDLLAIYLGRRDRFERDPVATMRLLKDWRFAVSDIDLDGRSDIVVRWPEAGEDGALEKSRVFLVREAKS